MRAPLPDPGLPSAGAHTPFPVFLVNHPDGGQGLAVEAGGKIARMRAADLLYRTGHAHYGWLIVAITFLAAALAIGTSNYAFGLFIEPLEKEFGWERTQISASLSFMAVSSLAAPFLGRLMDVYGARPVMTLSIVLFGLSFLLRPLMTELWHWYGLSLLQFIGFSGASILPASRLVAIWFPKIRGRVMGIAAMGNNFGGLTMPLVVGFVLTSATLEAGFVVIAAIAFAIAALAATIVHEHPVRAVANGEDQGTLGDESRNTPKVTLQGLAVSEALRSGTFYVMTFSMTLASFTYSTILPHVSAHLAAEGMSDTAVPLALSLLAIFGMIGKVVFGYLAERITARRAMMVSLGGQTAFVLMLAAYPDPPAVWVAVPLFGLCMGAYGALATLIIQENFGLKAFGSISGLSSLATVIPFATGPLLAGASFDLRGSYGPAFIIVAIMFGVAVLTLSQLRRPSLRE